MKRLCLAISFCLFFACSSVWAQQPSAGDLVTVLRILDSYEGDIEAFKEDLRSLIKIVDSHEGDINDITKILKGVDQKVDPLMDTANGGAKDITSRMVLYRFLVSYFSTAIRLQDKPVFSEKAFWNGIKDTKAKSYLKKHLKGNCPAQLYAEAGMIYPTMLEDWLTATDEIIYRGVPTVPDVDVDVDVASLKRDVEAAVLKKVQPEVEKAAKSARNAATDARRAAGFTSESSKIVSTATDIVETLTRGTATGVEYAEKSELNTVKAELEAELDTKASKDDLDELAGRVDSFKTADCVDQRINNMMSSLALSLEGKNDSARAKLYTAALARYGGEHLATQNYLRRRMWSEENIRKAAQANNGDLVEIDP